MALQLLERMISTRDDAAASPSTSSFQILVVQLAEGFHAQILHSFNTTTVAIPAVVSPAVPPREAEQVARAFVESKLSFGPTTRS